MRIIRQLHEVLKGRIQEVDNIWIKTAAIFIFLIVMFQFIRFNTVILKAHNDKYSLEKESQILSVVHNISNGYKIKYFDVITIIGGDRIFVVEYEKNNNDVIKTSLENLGWQCENDKLTKENFIAIVKNVNENTTKVEIAGIDTVWGKIYFTMTNV